MMSSLFNATLYRKYYSAIQIVTRFLLFTANGCTLEPFESEIMRSAGILYFSFKVFTTI